MVGCAYHVEWDGTLAISLAQPLLACRRKTVCMGYEPGILFFVAIVIGAA